MNPQPPERGSDQDGAPGPGEPEAAAPATEAPPPSAPDPGWRDGAIGLGLGCLGMPVAAIMLFSMAESSGDAGWVSLLLGAVLCLGAVVWLTRYFARRGTGGRFLMGLIVGVILPLLLIAGCFALLADGNMFR